MNNLECKSEIEHLKKEIESHLGMQSLNKFGSNIKEKPLSEIELKIFFSTLWPFFQETPSGILNLALRMSDYWREIDPWEANSIASHLLYASADEFGLHSIRDRVYPTHHELFISLSDFFGASSNILSSQEYMLQEGLEMGNISYEYYRNKGIAEGLGFHLASELTSNLEFNFFLNGFLANKKHYKLKKSTEHVLHFFQVHTKVEPDHLNHSEQVILKYQQKNLNTFKHIREGAMIYMNYYKNLFDSMNSKLS